METGIEKAGRNQAGKKGAAAYQKGDSRATNSPCLVKNLLPPTKYSPARTPTRRRHVACRGAIALFRPAASTAGFFGTFIDPVRRLGAGRTMISNGAEAAIGFSNRWNPWGFDSS